MILFRKEWSSLKKLMYLAGSALAEGWRTVTGAVASFIATRSTALPMEFDLVPIQDLHGQENPYPAGGGANKYPQIELTRTSENPTVSTNGDEYTINGSPSAYSQTIAMDSFKLPAGSYYFKVFTVSGSGYVTPQLRSTDGLTTYASASSPTFTLTEETTLVPRITWNVGTITNLKLKFMVVSGSTAPTSYSPYSNICPITGHDGFTTIGTDAILYDYQNDPPVQGTINGTTGKAASNLYRIRTKYIKVKPNTAYTIRTNLPYAYVHEYSSNNENSYIGNLGEWFEPPFSFTTTATTQYIRLVLALNSGGSTTKVTPSDLEYCNVLENAVSTIRQTTFPTPPGTVYGGHVRDNGDGTYDLTVDMYIIDMGDLTWTDGTSALSNMFYTSGALWQYKPKLWAKIVSSQYKGVKANWRDIKNGEVTIDNSQATPILRVRDANFSGMTGVQVATALSGVQLVYELYEPIQYTGLTLTALQSLIGQNNVWVDNADSVTVEYWGH